MGFIEFVLDAIGVIIIAALVLGCVVIGSGLVFALVVAMLALGWIPILMCATDFEWAIGWGNGSVVGAAAAVTTTFYLAVGAGLGVLWLTVPDKDSLPQGLKALAFLFPHPAAPHLKGAIAKRMPADGPKVVQAIRSKAPRTTMGEKIRAHAARTLRKDPAAEALRLKAEEELADATADMEEARARMEKARQRLKND
ncbi:MAG: hypothetical protein MI741_14500 [Rhodospirillales bacterium]|nr:hypothetical protein [Rhodospirillales bacterium]